jgi:roadblock/LC7 domain-containing protein
MAPIISFMLSLIAWVVILCTMYGVFVAMGNVPVSNLQSVSME